LDEMFKKISECSEEKFEDTKGAIWNRISKKNRQHNGPKKRYKRTNNDQQVNTSWSFPHSRLITGFVTRLTRRVPLVEQELLTLLEHLSSSPVFSGVCVTRSLDLYVCFVDRCLSFCTFFLAHCVVCSSSIYDFRLLLWYLQTFLLNIRLS
jgi:hypothetical protein